MSSKRLNTMLRGLGALALLAATGCGSGSPATTSEADPAKFSVQRITAARATLPSLREPAAQVGPPTAQPTLVPVIKEWGMRETAVDALARIGADSVEPLIETLRDPDPAMRANAARALSLMGPEAEAAIGALIEALGDSDAQVRTGAARALGQIGPAARSAIPALIEALRRAEAEERASGN